MSQETSGHSEKNFQQYQIKDFELLGLEVDMVDLYKRSQQALDILIDIVRRSRKLGLQLQAMRSQELR